MIKFRAWDKRIEAYLYNVQNAYDTLSGSVKYDDGEYADYDEDCFGDFLDNERYDVEQFTGLTDMSGNDIYVGDIVKNERNESRIVSFVLHAGCFAIGDCYFKSIGAGKILEIIGNVHENPELLEADK